MARVDRELGRSRTGRDATEGGSEEDPASRVDVVLHPLRLHHTSGHEGSFRDDGAGDFEHSARVDEKLSLS